jgi:hypothetical protein
MGSWVRDPALDQAETILWKRPANRTQSSWRAVGGRLFLTNSRLIFQPHQFDAVTGGGSWSAPLASVRSVGIEPRNWNPFSGGLRTRLRIELGDGDCELFVVNRVRDVVETIRSEVR